MTHSPLKIPRLPATASLAWIFGVVLFSCVFSESQLSCWGLSTATAQDDDPFGPVGGVEKKSDDDPFGGGAFGGDAFGGDAFGGDAFGDSASSKPAARRRRGGDTDKKPVKEDLIVEIIRESDPKKPDELVRAIITLVDIGQVAEAKKYLDILAPMELDDKTMFDLNMEFQTETFVRLRRVKELIPESAVFARKLLAASDRYVRQPERVNKFVSQLGDRSSDTRVAAMTGLLAAREDAVQPLIQALLDENRKDHHSQYLMALTRLGSIATEPLMAVATSDDPASFQKAIQVLAAAKDRAALSLLLQRYVLAQPGSAQEEFVLKMLERLTDSRPSRPTAIHFLENEFDSLQRKIALAMDDAKPRMATTFNSAATTVWTWNPSDRILTGEQQSAVSPLLRRSESLAGTLYEYNEGHPEARLRYWISLLNNRRYHLPPHVPMQADELIRENADYLETVLVEAIRSEHIEAAIAAAELLGEVGSGQLLQSDGGQASPIARACTHDNPRLRFAAMSTIFKWDPQEAFAGSSQVMNTASLFAGINGEQRILIVEPNGEFGAVLAGTLRSGAGLSAELSNTAREFLNRATDHSDFEFVVISASTNRPGPYEVLQRLRRDPRMGTIPVALVARNEKYLKDQLLEMRRLAQLDPLTLAMPWPGGPQSSQLLKQRMQDLQGRDYLSPETRITHANVALDGLLTIARNREQYDFYKLLPIESRIRRAIHRSELSGKTIELMGWLATPSAQTDLMQIASTDGLPIEQRKSAAKAFANAVSRRGILLRKPEILQLYEVYNSSEHQPEEIRDVLSSILDAMENRDEPQQLTPPRTSP